MILCCRLRCRKPILFDGSRAAFGSFSARRNGACHLPVTSQKRFNRRFHAFESEFYRETFICSKPESVKQEEVFASLTAPSWTTPSDGTKSSDLVLLLTKSLAHWLSVDNSFVLRALKHTWGTSNIHQRPCSVLAAVVDRIPAPCSRDILQLGFEGLAICASDKLPLLGPSGTAIDPESSSASEQGRLSFNFFHKYMPINRFSLTKLSVTLPLANTVFQNGQGNTLQLSQWIQDHRGFRLLEKKDQPHGKKTVYLPGQLGSRFNFPAISGFHEDEMRSFTIFTPLMPLTSLRQVSESTGNVVSKLTKSKDKKHIQMTASKELEQAVSKLIFRNRYRSTEETAVWALVIPKDLAQKHKDTLTRRNIAREVAFSKKAQMSRLVDYSSTIPLNLVWEGARLHRVLSGGGGWGTKEGLISLEHDTKYTGSTTSLPLDVDLNTFGDGQSFFTSVTKPGDMIAFYVGPNPSNHPFSVHQPLTGQSTQEFVNKTKRNLHKSSIDFGVVPQLQDLPQSPSQCDQELCDPTVIKDHFGALSEAGMAIGHEGENGPFPAETKMDTPFSKFSFQIISLLPEATLKSLKEVRSAGLKDERGILGDPGSSEKDSDGTDTHENLSRSPKLRLTSYEPKAPRICKITTPLTRKLRLNSEGFIKTHQNILPMEGSHEHPGGYKHPSRKPDPSVENDINSKSQLENNTDSPKTPQIRREVGRRTELIRKHDANSTVYGASLKHEQRMATIEYQQMMNARKSVPWRAKFNDPVEDNDGEGSDSAG